MQLKRHLPAFLAAAALAVLALGLGCAGSSSSSDAPASGPTGTVAMSVSDASTEDWAVIGVKLLGITLTPQGGGTPTTILTPPSTAPMLNLVQLDNLSDVLGDASVPVGTYTQATLTLSGSPKDVLLTVAQVPSVNFLADFSLTAGQTIPSYDISVKGVTDGVVTVPVTLATPLVVKEGQSSSLDVEFALSHPAFLVDHVQASGDTLWTVDFNDTVVHHPVADATQLVLRHLYGTFTQMAAGGGSITVTRDLPALPTTSAEAAVATLQALQISADTGNGGTWFYDLDGQQSYRITSFTSVAAILASEPYIRAAVRFENGTLVAARMWTSATFSGVWTGPEGHITQITSSQVYVESENGGAPVPVTITNATQFYFRTPHLPADDAKALGSGTAFLANLERGFKVHISPVDPTATPLVAGSVDIETARFTGYITGATASGFLDTRTFADGIGNYANVALGYISTSTPNGTDTSGNPVEGWQWWDLTRKAAADSNTLATFESTVGGSVDFGDTAGTSKVWTNSVAVPDSFTSFTGWNARFTVLDPVRMPLGTVVGGFSGSSFTMTVKGGNSTAVTVDVDASTLCYQVDNSGTANNPVYTVKAITLAAAEGMLDSGASVTVFGIPQTSGTAIQADTLDIYTDSGAI